MDMTGTFVDTCVQVREVIHNTDKVVVLYFFTEWSPKCRNIRFDFMFAEQQNTDLIYIAANMDRAKGIARKYHITLDDIPAVVVFHNGSIVFASTLITASHFYRTDYTVSPMPQPATYMSDLPQTTTTYLRESRDREDEEATDVSTTLASESEPAQKTVVENKPEDNKSNIDPPSSSNNNNNNNNTCSNISNSNSGRSPHPTVQNCWRGQLSLSGDAGTSRHHC